MVDSGGIKLLPSRMKCWTSDSLLGQALKQYLQAEAFEVHTEHGHLQIWLYQISLHLGGHIEVDPLRNAHLPRQHRLLGVAVPSWDPSGARIGVEVTCLDGASDGTLTTNQRKWAPTISL